MTRLPPAPAIGRLPVLVLLGLLCAPCNIVLAQTVERAIASQGFKLDHLAIPKAHLQHAGVAKDGFVALSAPKLMPGCQQAVVRPEERVIGITINDEPRAYPIKIARHHQIINDTIDDVPIAVTCCPLSHATAVFDRRIKDRETEFGVSGLLFNSNLLMYDRGGSPESLWSQMMGKGISGAESETPLVRVPFEVTTWRGWLTRYPKTWIMSDQGAPVGTYEVDPYEGYNRSPKLLFNVQPVNYQIKPKERVLGVWTKDGAWAYPLAQLAKRDLPVDGMIGDKKFTIVYSQADESARISSADEGVQWCYAFWFSWYAFHPSTSVFSMGNPIAAAKRPMPPSPAAPPIDKFGNPIHVNAGLARDGEFRGQKIVLWARDPAAMIVLNEQNTLWNVLKAKGFELVRRLGTFKPEWLNDANQFWIFSGGGEFLDEAGMKAIDRFVASGRGVYLLAENDPFFGEARQLAKRWFDAEVSGNYPGDRTVSLVRSVRQPNGEVKSTEIVKLDIGEENEAEGLVLRLPNLNHPILTDIDVIYEGWTVSHITPSPKLMPILLASDGKILVAAARNYRTKVIVDCGWTRYESQMFLRSAGTARFVENVAAYLAGKTTAVR